MAKGPQRHKDAGGASFKKLYVWKSDAPAEADDIEVGGVASVATAASSAVTNTTTETAFDVSYTIPANYLEAGDLVRIKFQGIATATNSTDTLTVRLKIGSTALIATAAIDVADNDIFGGEFDLVVRTAGGSGTCVGHGFYQDPDATGTQPKYVNLASTAIDTTATQAVTVTAEWSVASTANSCRLDILTVELL